ncbi:MAG: DegV family protein, partial [Anaeroplasma sp.]|nr:DegV family protein [Anaeroplasma sp.]
EIKEEPIDFDHPLEFGYSNHEENVLLLKDYLKDIVPNETKLCQISPVVGAHVGPGASAFFYISKNEVKKEKESILAKIKRKINS